jgi:hypothetical protein
MHGLDRRHTIILRGVGGLRIESKVQHMPSVETIDTSTRGYSIPHRELIDSMHSCERKDILSYTEYRRFNHSIFLVI